jgi:Kef-type K+ transport system membrane component KefB
MRAFLAAVIAAIVIAAVAAFVLERVQQPSQIAYSTEAVRL